MRNDHPYGLSAEETYELFTDTMTNFEDLSQEVYDLRSDLSAAIQDFQSSLYDINYQFRECCTLIMKLQSDLSFQGMWSNKTATSEKKSQPSESDPATDKFMDDNFPF